jgi:hypothetical protein
LVGLAFLLRRLDRKWELLIKHLMEAKITLDISTQNS